MPEINLSIVTERGGHRALLRVLTHRPGLESLGEVFEEV